MVGPDGGTRTGDEPRLVALALAGDAAAFASLYRSHVGAVARVVRDNVASPELAADLVQEAFARALERLGTLRQPDRFRPWLLAIARHVVTDHHRSAGRSRPRTLDAGDAPEQAGTGPGPDEVAELAELASLVAGCVAGLSRRDATAVALVTHLGLSPAEVGAALGVSPATAKVIVHRARRRLRSALALELLARRRGPGCPALEALGPADVIAASRHLRSCPACDELVRTEVALFAAGTARGGGPLQPEPLDADPRLQ